MKLRIKLPLLMTLLATLPLLMIGTIAFVKFKSVAEESAVTQVSKYLEQIKIQTDSLVATAQANVDLIAKDTLLVNYLLTENEEKRYSMMQLPLLRKLKSVMQVFPQYYEMRVLLPDGFEDLRLTHSFIPNKMEDEKSSEQFISMVKAKDDNHIQFLCNPDNKKISLFASKRIDIVNSAVDSFNARSKVRGYLVFTTDLGDLDKSLKDSPWAGGRFLITDMSGQVILPYSDKSGNGSALNDLALQHEEDQQIKFSILEMDGINYYHFSTKLQQELWLHALLPEDVLLKYSRNITRLVTVITVLSILVSIPLIILICQSHIISPLGALHQAFLDLSDNKEMIQVTTSGNDEITELGSEFNVMSHKLFKSNEKVRELAFNDVLTGLPNRFMFTKYLNRALECARQESSQVAVMFIDLDNFKHINDSLGHQSGDALLKDVATRLTQNMRKKDFVAYLGDLDVVARLGGDEFTVLLMDESSVANAELIARRIIDLIGMPFTINDKEYYIGCSIGIAYYPDNGLTIQDLVKNADIAMYHAKKIGKGGYHLFTDILSQQIDEYSNIEQKMRLAIENELFELYYQPIVSGETQQIVSLEALIRWNDPELGFVPPDKFIPLAEANGMITAIGSWVIQEACRQLKIWQGNGLWNIRVAVNVSAIQLKQSNFVEKLSNTIAESGITPGSLYVELTETSIIDSEQVVISTLHKLRERNIKIALDDFGTGYSSLSYLRNLPIDILKIDRAFICEINNRNNNVILSAVITMAHALGFEVVAEGIEEQEHLTFLLKEGCDMLQGYMFSRPKSAREITSLLFNDTVTATDISSSRIVAVK